MATESVAKPEPSIFGAALAPAIPVLIRTSRSLICCLPPTRLISCVWPALLCCQPWHAPRGPLCRHSRTIPPHQRWTVRAMTSQIWNRRILYLRFQSCFLYTGTEIKNWIKWYYDQCIGESTCFRLAPGYVSGSWFGIRCKSGLVIRLKASTRCC